MLSRQTLVGFAAGVVSVFVVETVRRALRRSAAAKLTDCQVARKAFRRVSCRPNHGPLGCTAPATHHKRGIEHTFNNGETRMLSVGNACSEVRSARMESHLDLPRLTRSDPAPQIFGGPAMAEMLRSGHEYEAAVLERVSSKQPAPALVQHTSSSLPPQLGDFVGALEGQLPAYVQKADDWVVSLQVEGGSAVHAAIEMLLQLQACRGHAERVLVAVADRSYHGPPSTCFGVPAKQLTPDKSAAKPSQIVYPAPTPFAEHSKSGIAALRIAWKDFFAKHGATVGVVVVEPQWGSSCAAATWPKELLAEFVGISHAAGCLVVSDEVMCGLGRHGLGACFLSDAWGIEFDALTFGKAVACGMFPLAGAVMCKGVQEMGAAGRSVAQSHTYAAASPRALMAAANVLNSLPIWAKQVAASGAVLGEQIAKATAASNGKICAHGHGLMRGMLLEKSVTGARCAGARVPHAGKHP